MLCCDYNWLPQLLMKLEQKSWYNYPIPMMIPRIIVEVCTSWSRHCHRQNKIRKLY
ncbi:hypothetical protein R3W88_019754 [Solanum pinnatisectum]|uniref:Uncharacterized protein n=1 Tax=Solanum pinnatisectum TaxID=50273 RepID=A0AAV9KP53_9SOLN|nr:hypothetical protein R3W88_019754 [Solanum pinnatisectum]